METLYQMAVRQADENFNQKMQKMLALLPEDSPTRETILELLGDDSGKVKLRDATETDWPFTAEKGRDVFVQDDALVIRPIQAGDEDFFCELRRQTSLTYRSAYYLQADHLHELFENEVFLPQTFYCIIERAGSREPIGYIGIKDTGAELWEVVIELAAHCVNRGLGARSLYLFLNELHRISGKSEVLARIETDNIPSQKCFEKLGAELLGMRHFAGFKTAEAQACFEEQHLDRIDDNMKALARRLNTEPRKLLSHTLDYRLALPIEEHNGDSEAVSCDKEPHLL